MLSLPFYFGLCTHDCHRDWRDRDAADGFVIPHVLFLKVYTSVLLESSSLNNV